MCSKAWQIQLTNSIFFVGAFAGNGLFGVLCDCIGRKKPLFLATSMVAASMFMSLASPSYWFTAVFRALTGMGAAGQSHSMFLLCTECTGPVYRWASLVDTGKMLSQRSSWLGWQGSGSMALQTGVLAGQPLVISATMAEFAACLWKRIRRTLFVVGADSPPLFPSLQLPFLAPPTLCCAHMLLSC